MKKQYMKPTQEVVLVKVENHLLDTSSTPDAGLNTGRTVNANSLDSRRGSDWDDE